LTGLWVFSTEPDDDGVKKRILAGEKPFVDDRFRNSSSNAEQAWLVHVMERCWEHDPKNRIDIFTAVQLLRAALAGDPPPPFF
jgi:hypothetical protein